MYRRRLSSSRRDPGSTLARFMLLGIVFGLSFMLFDRWRNPPPAVAPPAATLAPTDEPTPPPTSVSLPTVTPIAKANLIAPTAGINAQVVDVYLDGSSWDVSSLGEKVGHLEGTAWFGKPGNIALAGHVEMRDGRPGIFARIDEVKEGDPIILKLNTVEQSYRVTQILRVQADDLSVIYPSTVEKITLITCDQYDFIQNAYLERVVIVAERVTNPA